MSPDISMCDNKSCPLNSKCYRFTAKPNKFYQSYSDFQYTIDKKGKVSCEYFWDNDKK